MQRQEAFRSGKRLDRQALSRLLEEALAAYERAHGVAGYRRAQWVLAEARLGDRLAAWWDSLGLDEEQQVWMARLWEVFRTSHMVGELDERLGRYEEAVVEALGVERSGVMLWSSGVWYSFAVWVFGREGWVEAFWALVRGLIGVDGGGGGMARWGVLGGRGWFRLAQQNTTCPLNTVPTVGDQVRPADILSILIFMIGTCELKGKLLTPFAGIWGAVLGCITGAIQGFLIVYPVYYESWRMDFIEASIAWCERNRDVCEGVEAYQSFCDEVTKPQ